MKKKSTPICQNLRLILAITAKDVLDAVKNKTTLTALICVLFIVVMYKFLPALSLDDIPFVFLYDAGRSAHTSALENSDSITVRVYGTFEGFQEGLRLHAAGTELGLVLPADFDQTLAAGEVPYIQGYGLNWMDQQKLDERCRDLENRIASIVGAPVRITMDGGTLTMLPHSAGGFLTAAGMVLAIFMVGMTLIPNQMLEEKTTRTMDALLVSPAGSGQIVVAKALSGMFYSLVFIIMIFVLNSGFILQWGLALLAVLLGTLMSVAMGLILGTLIGNRQQLIMVASVIMFPLFLPVFLSLMVGLIPAWLVTIMRWLPPVALAELMRISFTEEVMPALVFSRLGLLLVTVIALLVWEIWLVRRLDR